MDTTRIEQIIARSDLARLLPERARALTRPVSEASSEARQQKDTPNVLRRITE